MRIVRDSRGIVSTFAGSAGIAISTLRVE